MTELNELLAEALSPRGTRDLELHQMLQLLTVGEAAGLVLFSVDVTTVGQARPLPEWMFRLSDEELETVPADRGLPMALEFYRKHASDPELTAARFQVYLERPD
jgi:hypothetical protein